VGEIGYIYAFTKDQVQKALEPYRFICHLRSVKIEGDREYQDLVEELKNRPDASIGFKTVVLSVFRVSRDSSDFKILDAQYPGHEVFLVVNPTVRALMETAGEYRCNGSMSMRTIEKPQQELFLYFVATPMESNRHLWPEDYWPQLKMTHPKHRITTVAKTKR
jgi:hypothetical protein